ncbi:MAG: hypothetical protein D6772_04435 [Bacteroidetes bacterium]|nr:MAG: hypothetical protein D6772_04435 [Bacteroidota bacterium]
MLRSILLLFVLLTISVQASAQLDLLDKKKSTTCVNREFTVMTHLVRDTFGVIGTQPAAVASALEILNLWFEPICVTFVSGEVDTIDNFQYWEPLNFNEVEQIWTNHNKLNRINLYVIGSTANLTFEPVFATQEGILDPRRGGVLVTNEVINDFPLWLVHAFGHYCGLLNTNEAFGEELVNGSNCTTASDEICDTPADPQDPAVPLQGLGVYVDEECRFISTQLDPNREFYVPQTGNLMSYYPYACWCGLTFEQFERMANLLGRSPLW